MKFKQISDKGEGGREEGRKEELSCGTTSESKIAWFIVSAHRRILGMALVVCV